MRVLLDEHVDWRLSRSFGEGFEVETVIRRGWGGRTNGELLELAQSAGFDALITTDRGVPHQQNLSNFDVAVVVLRAGSNRLRHLAPIVEAGRKRCAPLHPTR
ncbi:MAG: DUF5615 family PIN-like protein [Rubrobacter sp.]|nr:DUF5615 family PIN-like protein [Rubrobacter sp.]